MSDNLGQFVIDLRFAAQVAGDAKRTVCCEPDQRASLQSAVESAGLSAAVSVVASPACPPGKVLVVDERAIEAAFRSALQRSIHTMGSPGGRARRESS